MWCILHPRAVSLVQVASRGRSMPVASLRKSVRTSVILPESAHAHVQALADASNVSAAWVIRAAVLQFLREHGDETQLPLRLPKLKKGA